MEQARLFFDFAEIFAPVAPAVRDNFRPVSQWMSDWCFPVGIAVQSPARFNDPPTHHHSQSTTTPSPNQRARSTAAASAIVTCTGCTQSYTELLTAREDSKGQPSGIGVSFSTLIHFFHWEATEPWSTRKSTMNHPTAPAWLTGFIIARPLTMSSLFILLKPHDHLLRCPLAFSSHGHPGLSWKGLQPN